MHWKLNSLALFSFVFSHYNFVYISLLTFSVSLNPLSFFLVFLFPISCLFAYFFLFYSSNALCSHKIQISPCSDTNLCELKKLKIGKLQGWTKSPQKCGRLDNSTIYCSGNATQSIVKIG